MVWKTPVVMKYYQHWNPVYKGYPTTKHVRTEQKATWSRLSTKPYLVSCGHQTILKGSCTRSSELSAHTSYMCTQKVTHKTALIINGNWGHHTSFVTKCSASRAKQTGCTTIQYNFLPLRLVTAIHHRQCILISSVSGITQLWKCIYIRLS